MRKSYDFSGGKKNLYASHQKKQVTIRLEAEKLRVVICLVLCFRMRPKPPSVQTPIHNSAILISTPSTIPGEPASCPHVHTRRISGYPATTNCQ